MRGAVLVYVGRREMGTLAALMVVGGQGNRAVEDAGIEDGTPPVCHGLKSPSKGSEAASSDSHMPRAVRGSFGIHPLRRPSW